MPECHSNGSLEVEKEINKSLNQKIPIPGDGLNLPASLPGHVELSFVPVQFALCKSAALEPILNTPAGFLTTGLSLSASDHSGGTADHGPFVYSPPKAAWDPPPGAPPGQQLASKFDVAKFELTADPQLVASFKKGGPTLEFQIASATISAPTFTVRLVAAGSGPSALSLQAAVGVALEIGIDGGRVAPEEATGTDEEMIAERQAADAAEARATAIQDVADEYAGDIVVGAEVDLAEHYGVFLTLEEEQAAFSALQSAIVSALEADPVILAFEAAATPPADAPVLEDSVPTDPALADPAAIDGAIAGDEITVDGLDLLLVLFL